MIGCNSVATEVHVLAEKIVKANFQLIVLYVNN
jgi:hypothetical protein